MQEVAKNTRVPRLSCKEMLDEIRANHIDINPIIQEELDNLLPQFIEDVVIMVYQARIVEAGQ